MSDGARRARAAAVVVAVGMALFGTAAAAATAAPTETQLSSQSVRQLVGVGVGPGNYTVVAWVAAEAGVGSGPGGAIKKGPSRVMVAVRAGNRARFNRPRRISPFNAQVASMAVAETGKTMVVWADSDGRIKARYRTATKGWSKTMGVAGHGATAFPDIPDVDIAEDGTAVVGWRNDRRRHNGAQMVAIFHPKRGFRKPVRVGPKIDYTLSAARGQGMFNAVSARNGGKGTVVWASSCGANRKHFKPAFAVNLDIRRRPSRPAKIPFSKCPHADISLSENARGKAVLAINGHGFTSMVRLAVRPAGNRRFGPAVRISPKGTQASFAKVAAHRDGSATLVAPMFDDAGPAGTLGMTFSKPRPLDPERDQITPRGTGGTTMAANSRGDVVSLSTDTLRRRWVYSHRPPGSPFEPSVELPFDDFLGRPEIAIAPSSIAVGPTGKAVAAVTRANWDGDRVLGDKGVYVFEGFPQP